MAKIKSYYNANDVVDVIKSKIKKLENDKKNNYQIETYYVSIESKIDILNEILDELEQ